MRQRTADVTSGERAVDGHAEDHGGHTTPRATSGSSRVSFEAARVQDPGLCDQGKGLAQGVQERMKGLEPTTFCMASEAGRSREKPHR
jgi:hypothetical protein